MELVRNLLRVQNDLPATILEARGFGSVLRGKPNPHDLDIVFLYEMTESQRADWAWFSAVFGSVHAIGKLGETLQKRAQTGHKLLRETLTRYLNEDSLPEALKHAEVKQIAKRLQLNLLWASCYNRTVYLYGEHGNGFFIPRVEQVLKKIVAEPFARRGIQVHFVDKESIDASTNRVPDLGLVKSFRKIWDPNIAVVDIPGRFQMTETEFRSHLYAELDHFHEQQVETSYELRKSIDELQQMTMRKDIRLEMDKLLPDFTRRITEKLSTRELQHHCEEARESLRSMEKLLVFLPFVSDALDFEDVKDSVTLADQILRFPKEGLTAAEIRTFMNTMGLPQEEFISFYIYGQKRVVHETTDKVRAEIVAQDIRWQKARKFRQRLTKLLPFKKRLAFVDIVPKYSGEVHLTNHRSVPKFGDSFGLRIVYDCPEAEFRRLNDQLNGAGWQIRELQSTQRYRRIEKTLELSLNETMVIAEKKLITTLAPFKARKPH